MVNCEKLIKDHTAFYAKVIKEAYEDGFRHGLKHGRVDKE